MEEDKNFTLQAPETTQPETDKPTVTVQSQNVNLDQKPLVKEFPRKTNSGYLKTILIVIIICTAGIATGYLLSGLSKPPQTLKSSETAAKEGVKVDEVFGIADEKTFRDSVEGIMVKGGIDGEGSHHLLRPGGESQNVYLTSSIVDLDLFIDHKVKVWGETFKAQKAGWLMDVGRVKVIELNAEKPLEE